MTSVKKIISILFVLSICTGVLTAQYYNGQGGYQDPYQQDGNQQGGYQDPYAQQDGSQNQQGGYQQGGGQYGYGVQLSSIPQNAQNFIKQHFANTQVTFIERDWDDIEVYLANGIQIEFFPNGDWKEVKGYGNVPSTILPPNVMNTVKRTYPNAAIVKIEKQFTIFEVKLNNMMELYIDNNGQLLGQKWDD